MHAQYPQKIQYTVGLHPCYVDAKWEEDLDLIKSFFSPQSPYPQPIGLGEIGLDAFHLPEDEDLAKKTLDLQRVSFKAHLDFLRTLSCPIVIHSRQLFDECLQFIDKSDIDPKRFIFHCFVEGPAEAKQLIDRGISASFTGIITYKNAEKVREALKAFGPENIMLETDCPFLTPVPHRGTRNEPAYVYHVAEAAAKILNVSVESLSSLTEKRVEEFWL